MAPTKLQNNRVKNILAFAVVTLSIFTLTACSGGAPVKPDFDSALQKHFAAIDPASIRRTPLYAAMRLDSTATGVL